jgi:plastocyanin
MKIRVFFSGILVVALVMVSTLACKKYNNNYNSSNSPTVHMKNSAFSSASLQVATGTTVIWNNDDMIVHTVTADDGSFSSSDIQPGGTFSWTFKSTGTFAYHDKHNTAMTGIVTVVSTGSGGGSGY